MRFSLNLIEGNSARLVNNILVFIMNLGYAVLFKSDTERKTYYCLFKNNVNNFRCNQPRKFYNKSLEVKVYMTKSSFEERMKNSLECFRTLKMCCRLHFKFNKIKN